MNVLIENETFYKEFFNLIKLLQPSKLKFNLKLFDTLLQSLSTSLQQHDKLKFEILSYLLFNLLINFKNFKLNKNDFNDWCKNLKSFLSRLVDILNNKCNIINKFYANSSTELNSLINCYLKPLWLYLENDQYLKYDNELKFEFINVISISIVHYNQSFNSQTSILSNLQYFDHLSEFFAELLSNLFNKFQHNSLSNQLLSDISGLSFNGNDLKAPRSFSKFIIKLSQLIPSIVLKNIVLLQSHIDSDAYTMRNALIEVIGNLICYLSTLNLNDNDNDFETNQTQIQSFFNVLIDRFLDNNSYVRSKVLGTFSKIIDLPTKFPKQRIDLLLNTLRHLDDKSSSVRKNATNLLTKLILTHPYGLIHGGRLNETEWNERLSGVDQQLSSFDVQDNQENIDENENENENNDDESENRRKSKKFKRKSLAAVEKLSKNDSEYISKLRLTKNYYMDALNFIKLLNKATPTVSTLLGSTNKSEVLEAIEFFRVGYEYGIESSEIGIKRMLHLIWSKDNTVIEDGKEVKGVRARLIDTYKSLYLEPIQDLSITPQQQVSRIAKNLIQMTFNATLAELTSLEALISTIMSNDGIHPDVINKLWQVYSK